MTVARKLALMLMVLPAGCVHERTSVNAIDVPPARSISISNDHACVVTRAAEVHCWGDTRFHHIDDFAGDYTGRPGRVRVGDGARAVRVGYGHVCSSSADSITCWWREPMGDAEDSFVWRRELSSVQSMAMSNSALCWVDDEGVASCEGWFTWRWRGRDPTYFYPTAIPAPGPVSAVALGSASVFSENGCVVGREHDVRCWGRNYAGQLGDISLASSDEQHPIEVPALVGVVEVALGELHMCARLTDGGVACWGGNRGGQADGIGAMTTIPPTRVEGVSGARQIRVLDHRSCAVVEEGRVVCWGARPPPRGRLRPDEVAPTELPILGEVVDLGLAHHVCAVLAEGEVVCMDSHAPGNPPLAVRLAAVGDVEAVAGVVRRVRPRVASAPWE